jgi:hypothetical protein
MPDRADRGHIATGMGAGSAILEARTILAARVGAALLGNRRDRAISVLGIARSTSRSQRAAPATKAATMYVACRSSDCRARS